MRPGPARRIAVAVVAAVLAALAAHGAVWWWVTGEIERQVLANLSSPPLQGWQASAGAPRRSGWPFAATVEVPTLALAGPGGEAERLRWKVESLTASLSLAHPRTLVLALHGAQSLQVGAAPPLPLRAAMMQAEVPLEPDVPVRGATIAIAELRSTLPTGEFRLARLDLQLEVRPPAQQGETAAALAATAAGLVLPGAGWVLGPEIRRLVLDIAVTGPVPPQTPDLAARAEAWRDGGGAVTLRRLDLAWGEVTASGGATLALDAQLQPMGAATARIAGHEALLRALTAAGVLPPRTTLAAGAVLGLLARPQADGPPAVEAPLSLQNRTLALGRIPLFRLPELVWRPPS